MSPHQTSLGAPREAAATLAQWPNQVEALAEVWRSRCERPLRERFAELLPVRPFAADDPHHGVRILTRPHALRRRHLQFNAPFSLRWILHDIDDSQAYFVHRDACLPPPNVIAINPGNGHAHSAYLLAVPVAKHCAARPGPLRLFAAVERGIARRIGADRRFTALIAKNPLHADWRVEWRRDQPYTLEELADWLFPCDMAPDVGVKIVFGAGRNCMLFDELRMAAYREVRAFKRASSIETFRDRLHKIALAINHAFSLPLGPSELRAIVKSVTCWTWSHFSDAAFSQRQSMLGKRGAAKRWAGHVVAEKIKPWEAEGISRRTWYRERHDGCQPSERHRQDVYSQELTPSPRP